MGIRWSIVVVLLVGLPSAARADDAACDPCRSPTNAVIWSIGATVGGVLVASAAGAIQPSTRGRAETRTAVGLVGAAMILYGPTAGHAYAGRPFTGWLGLRALGAVGAAASVPLWLCIEGCAYGTRAALAGLVLGGASVVTYVVATIADIWTAPAEARRYNRRHAVTMVPTFARGAGGLTIAGRF